MCRASAAPTVTPMTASTGTSRTWIVECFAPGIREGHLLAVGREAEAASAGLRADGRDVEYQGATLVPEDEVVFLHYRAVSVDDVRAASANLPIACTRVVESVAVSPEIP